MSLGQAVDWRKETPPRFLLAAERQAAQGASGIPLADSRRRTA
jgi:hypothetical protein